MRIFRILFALFLLLPFMVTADTFDNNDEKSKVTPYGYIDFELGQIVKGRTRITSYDSTFAHTWLQNIHGRLGLQYQALDWLELRTGFELRMWFNTFPVSVDKGHTDPRNKNWSIYLHEAQGKFKLLDKEALSMDMAIGYFPYKYNPEVCNLGEYLFRTGTYPMYIINDYDFPLARLAGLRYTVDYNNDLIGFKFDQLILTEMQMWPYHDLTLSSILDFNILKDEPAKKGVFNIGAGISFAHLVPVDKGITTPKDKLNTNGRTTYKRDTTGYHFGPTDTLLLDTLWDFDESYYTFKGTKVMVRTTIDPFAFLRNREGFAGDFFGKHGGKIYGELAIIGFKNYPANARTFNDSLTMNPFGYDDIKERMPMMFGVTIPCWKILDMCAVEFEYFDCPYPNDYARVYQERFPLPGEIKVADSTYTFEFYDKPGLDGDNVKWSIFMKKTIKNHLGFILQICRDHQRWQYSGRKDSWDFEDAMVKKGHWAWNFKTEFKF